MEYNSLRYHQFIPSYYSSLPNDVRGLLLQGQNDHCSGNVCMIKYFVLGSAKYLFQRIYSRVLEFTSKTS